MNVVSLHDITKKDIDQAGGKGANLGELINNGFPIPPGFVVCADSYADVLSTIDTSKSHDEIVAELLSWKFPQSLDAAISESHETLQSNRGDPVIYAVRSSATAEDLGMPALPASTRPIITSPSMI